MTLHVRSNIKQRRIFTRKHTQTQGIYPKTMNNEGNTDDIYMMDTYIYIYIVWTWHTPFRSWIDTSPARTSLWCDSSADHGLGSWQGSVIIMLTVKFPKIGKSSLSIVIDNYFWHLYGSIIPGFIQLLPKNDHGHLGYPINLGQTCWSSPIFSASRCLMLACPRRPPCEERCGLRAKMIPISSSRNVQGLGLMSQQKGDFDGLWIYHITFPKYLLEMKYPLN